MWQEYIQAGQIEEALQALAEKGDSSRLIAGGTDIILELERGARPGVDTLVDVSRISGLDQIRLDEKGWIHLGPLVTHNHCVASKLLREMAFPLVRAAWEVGSPQIRNRGTIAGNLVTASPANDTITPLFALGAQLTLRSSARGERTIAIADFYQGVRRVDMYADEMVVDIAFPALQSNQRGTFVKFALRRAQAISVANVAIVLTMEGTTVHQAAIALGSVAPTIIRATAAEQYLAGKSLSSETILEASRLAVAAARPISDIRSSSEYRKRIVEVITRRALDRLAVGGEQSTIPEQPVLLWGRPNGYLRPITGYRMLAGDPIETEINGETRKFSSGQGKSLLRFLREDALLIGTKEGCAEGECGACTVFLDGKAVMSCMVPAERAHGAKIVTIEGVGKAGELHPVQSAFIAEGAVQCGYCTPGFLMSAVKLLEEKPNPRKDEIQQAFTGNLCRCTGYYKIVNAVERAALGSGGD